MKRPGEWWLSVLIVVLGVPVHVTGLLRPSIYRDPPIIVPQNLGTDLVTLCVGLPLLAVTTAATHRGSLRARLLWLGALGFLVYDYGMYALGVRWNELFLLYVVLFGASLYALIIGLSGTDAVGIHAARSTSGPARSVAAYLIVIAVIAATMWLTEEVGAAVRGAVPPSVAQFETPTNIVHVFDLAVVLPALVIAAVMLLRDRPWGAVLAGMVLVKATTIGLWVAVLIWLSARRGFPAPAGYTAFFVGLTVVGAALTWRFLAGFGPVRGGVAQRVGSGSPPPHDLPGPGLAHRSRGAVE